MVFDDLDPAMTGTTFGVVNIRFGRNVVLAVALAIAASACGEAPDVSLAVDSEGDNGEEASTLEAVTTTRPIPSDTAPPLHPEDEGQVVPLQSCDAVTRLAPSVVGNLGPMANVDEEVMGVAMTFAAENPDIFAGLWIDREYGGTLVVAVTRDAEQHRAALAARGPSPDDIAMVNPRPPVRDDRPLGERDDLAFDVVEAEFSEAHLRGLQDVIFQSDFRPGFSMGGGIDPTLNKLALDLVDPTDEELETLAAIAGPNGDMACVNITGTVDPVDLDPLTVIPESEDDTVLACGGYGPTFTPATITNPTPFDAIDHPAAHLMVEVIADPPAISSMIDTSASMPTGDWFVLDASGADTAMFALNRGLEPGFLTTALFEETASGWVFLGWDPTCDPEVALPEGANRIDVAFDPAFGSPQPSDTTLHLLVTEQACASGEAVGDRLRGPQVVESDTEVAVAFAAVSQTGMFTCPGNPSTPVTVELSQPLGDRTVVDGLTYPRRAIGS